MNLSIIIVNYNLTREIENCLRSFLGRINLVDYEIIIVDNNSPVKDLPALENKFPQENIHFLYQEENLGFGGGCNYGFSKASGSVVCFLNPDTIIKEDIFNPIIKLLSTDKSVGIVGPKQLTRKPCFDFSAGFQPNIIFQFFHLLGIGVFFEGFITYLYTRLKGENYFKVHWILGAAIFIRYELFNMVKGFDRDYFMFSEEVDLCRRVSKAGFKIIYYPSLEINHIGSVSGKKDYSLFTIRTYSSKDIFFSKHYKSLNKFIMRLILRLEILIQIFIWLLLYPLNKTKSRQKIKGFIYLLKHNLKYIYQQQL